MKTQLLPLQDTSDSLGKLRQNSKFDVMTFEKIRSFGSKIPGI